MVTYLRRFTAILLSSNLQYFAAMIDSQHKVVTRATSARAYDWTENSGGRPAGVVIPSPFPSEIGFGCCGCDVKQHENQDARFADEHKIRPLLPCSMQTAPVCLIAELAAEISILIEDYVQGCLVAQTAHPRQLAAIEGQGSR
jgi:hypothetical protein